MNVTLLFPFLTVDILLSRISWSIRLRWLAISGYFAATIISKTVFHLPLPYTKIWGLLAILGLINLIYYIFYKNFKNLNFVTELVILHIHIILDLLFLAVLLHYSGGIENPVYLFFVFHIVLSSIIFPRWIPIILATLVVFLFAGLIYLEYNGIIPHYAVFESTCYANEAFIYIILTVFTITCYVTAYICMSFMHIYRESKRIIDKQHQQLIEADKQKTQFFQFASHELKSPIIAIKSTVDGVLKSFSGRMDEKAVNLLNRASTRATQMLEIIKELLELSHRRVSAPESKREIVEVKDALTDIIDQELHLAEAKKIDLQHDITKTDARFVGKKSDFIKIFDNLISNAIRYTKNEGKIRIKSDVRDDQLTFEIEDSGIGIPKDDIEKIFNEFYRSENARKTINFGTGLGLSLVKQLVEYYGGRITVESEVAKGSKFKVHLPVNKETNG